MERKKQTKRPGHKVRYSKTGPESSIQNHSLTSLTVETDQEHTVHYCIQKKNKQQTLGLLKHLKAYHCSLP